MAKICSLCICNLYLPLVTVGYSGYLNCCHLIQQRVCFFFYLIQNRLVLWSFSCFISSLLCLWLQMVADWLDLVSSISDSTTIKLRLRYFIPYIFLITDWFHMVTLLSQALMLWNFSCFISSLLCLWLHLDWLLIVTPLSEPHHAKMCLWGFLTR